MIIHLGIFNFIWCGFLYVVCLRIQERSLSDAVDAPTWKTCVHLWISNFQGLTVLTRTRPVVHIIIQTCARYTYSCANQYIYLQLFFVRGFLLHKTSGSRGKVPDVRRALVRTYGSLHDTILRPRDTLIHLSRKCCSSNTHAYKNYTESAHEQQRMSMRDHYFLKTKSTVCPVFVVYRVYGIFWDYTRRIV